MNRYVKSILVFDVVLPLLGLAVPCAAVFLAVCNLRQQQAQAAERYEAHEARVRQAAALRKELASVNARPEALKALVSPENLEARVDQAIAGALERFTADDIDRTLRDYGGTAPVIGSYFSQSRRLTLKFSSRWETLNLAAVRWETEQPHLILESLTIQRANSGNSLESMLTYAVLTDE